MHEGGWGVASFMPVHVLANPVDTRAEGARRFGRRSVYSDCTYGLDLLIRFKLAEPPEGTAPSPGGCLPGLFRRIPRRGGLPMIRAG